MKKLALLALALELAVCGCASNTPSTTTRTSSTGNWEAQLTGGVDQASRLNFVTSFTVTANDAGTAEPLDITGFGFINNGACFAPDQNGITTETESGLATITTNNGTDQVTGSLTMQVSSVTPAGNTLTLTGNLTGTSNGTSFTTGTLSNGVVQGTWTLTGGGGDPSCTGGGNFLMCQGTATCTPP